MPKARVSTNGIPRPVDGADLKPPSGAGTPRPRPVPAADKMPPDHGLVPNPSAIHAHNEHVRWWSRAF